MINELALTDVGDGPTVVLLHAFPCNRRMWDSQVDALESTGFRVLAPDLPGFGESEASSATPDLAIAGQAVFDLLDDRALGQVVVAGLSMGGYVAMEMLRQQPGRVSALALLDTKSTIDDDPARQNRLKVADMVLAEGSSSILTGMIPKLIGETSRANRPAVVERVEQFIAEASPGAVAWAQRAMAARPDSGEALRSFEGPALVVYGEEDTLSPKADQDVMVSALTNVTLQSIPGAGHLSALEQPSHVSDVLIGLGGKVR